MTTAALEPVAPAAVRTYTAPAHQLCVCAPGQPVNLNPLPRRDGQRHGAIQHAAQHRRLHRHRDGHHRPHSPRRPAPERPRRPALTGQPHPAAESGADRGLSRPPPGPQRRPPRLLRPALRPNGAAGCAQAYVDIFRWTALLAFFFAAAVWLFKKPIKHTAPPPGVHSPRHGLEVVTHCACHPRDCPENWSRLVGIPLGRS
jgi:hypothetical protein